MKKVIFNKSFIFSIIVAVMSALLIACFFIPVIGPSERCKGLDVMSSYSCKDIVVASNIDPQEDNNDLSPSEMRALSEISGSSDSVKLVKTIGIVGLVNTMLGAIMLVVSILSIFYRSTFVSSGLLTLFIIGVLASVAIIIMMCIYLKMPCGGTSLANSYWNSVSASAFVMLGATLIGGTCSCFIKQ